MQTGTGKTAEDYEHHRIAAGEQQQDRRPHPGKEILERCAHQPQALRRLKRDERRAQADINREHPGFEAFVGDYSALPRTYLLDDYLRATNASSGSAGSIPLFHRTRSPWHFVGRKHRVAAACSCNPLSSARWLMAMPPLMH